MRVAGTLGWPALGHDSSRAVKLPVLTSAPEAVIDAVAVARLTRLVQEDDVWPMPEVRAWWLTRVGDSRLADLVSCPWCLSPYVAALVVALRIRFPLAWPWVARALVGSAVTGHLAQLAH